MDYAINNNKLLSKNPYTFLVRSLNGMAINTDFVPAGVNVNIDGAVRLNGQNLVSVADNCT
jgi:hypothetical protein